MNGKIVLKYLKFCPNVELTLLGFPSSYMVESAFSHVHFFSKLRSTLNIEQTDLWLKLTILQPNILYLFIVH